MHSEFEFIKLTLIHFMQLQGSASAQGKAAALAARERRAAAKVHAARSSSRSPFQSDSYAERWRWRRGGNQPRWRSP